MMGGKKNYRKFVIYCFDDSFSMDMIFFFFVASGPEVYCLFVPVCSLRFEGPSMSSRCERRSDRETREVRARKTR